MAIVNDVQISLTIVTRKEKTTSLKPNAITVKKLAPMLQNVDSPRIKLRRRLTMWSKKTRSLKQCS